MSDNIYHWTRIAIDPLVKPEPTMAGMSLRDWFAGQALAGQLAAEHDNSEFGVASTKDLAVMSYRFADAMLAARTKGEEK